MHLFMLLLPAGLLLIVPKFMLAIYMNELLWANFGTMAFISVLIQDLALAFAVLAIMAAALRRPTLLRLCFAYGVAACLLALLLLDARIRQLWLQPTSLDLVLYSWKFAPDLTSGVDMFFKFPSGLGASFRKWFVYVMALQFAYHLLSAYSMRRLCYGSPASGRRIRARHVVGMSACLAVVLGLGSMWVPSHMYSAEKNVLVAGVLNPLRSGGKFPMGSSLADDCDQKLRPPAAAASRPAGEGGIEPFDNLMLFMLESARWRDLNLHDSGPTAAPALRQLARTGLLAKCYVSVPHSSKALFTTMTGWHSCAGVEILEGARLRTPSVLWSLREQREARTFCFSVQNLLFENTNGILMSCGVETRFGPHELRRLAGHSGRRKSSFGDCDDLLLDVVGKIIQPDDEHPFAAVILPLAAHHPYDYPDKPAGEGATLEHYWKSITYLDSTVRHMLNHAESAGLLDNTLVVLVGDHGQSFGEHGTYIHNNSMYEEEITVPLIFWSADGRLARDEVLVARQIDIAPTIAQLMGVHDPKHVRQGDSMLSPAYRHDPVYVSSFFEGASMALIEGADKLIWFPTENRMLGYNLLDDPDERNPLTVDQETADRVRYRLAALVAYQEMALRD